MAKTLKSSVTQGMFWSAIEKFSIQGGQFFIGIVLARLLMPSDYGLIGMLSIFIAISQTFVDSGMGSGLIQKKNRTEIDFSTVFIFNLVVSSLFYILLFFSSPLIAEFYNKPELIVLTRVLGLNILINSFSIVQRTKFTINIDFKSIAKVNVVSVISSGAIAVFFAYLGWGVWALVVQNLLRAVISAIMLWFLSKWKISLKFSKESFKNLFGFGSKLLISGLYARTFNEVYNISIGKAYAAAELGFYTRAKNFAEITSGTVTSILHQVTYPALASLQEDKNRLVSVYRRLIKMTSFFIIPSMTLMALMADPFINLFLTSKWAPAIVLLQWMCFARIITPISVINMNILNAVGRSDLFLKVDLSKLPLIILALVITIPLGVKAMVIGHVVTSGISFFINAYMPGKMFKYGPMQQLKDMVPFIIATLIMAVIVYLSTTFITSLFLKLVVGGLAGAFSYIFVCYILKIDEISEVRNLILKIKNKVKL